MPSMRHSSCWEPSTESFNGEVDLSVMSSPSMPFHKINVFLSWNSTFRPILRQQAANRHVKISPSASNQQHASIAGCDISSHLLIAVLSWNFVHSSDD
eukprot:766368-Hanusia_phi.AAC.2